MKKIFFYLSIFLILTPAFSQDRIFLLDIDYLINNSNAGKQIVSKLKIINNQNISEINSYKENLEKQEDEINKVKNILSKEELNVKIENLKNNFTSYQEKKNEILNNYNNLKNKELQNFFTNITPYIEEFMKINSIDIIIDKKNIFIANANYDITEMLIEFLNNKIKNEKIE